MDDRFSRIIRHEVVNLLGALALIFTSLWEVGDTLFADIASFNFSTGHGVLIFGAVHALHAMQELVEQREMRRKAHAASDAG